MKKKYSWSWVLCPDKCKGHLQGLQIFSCHEPFLRKLLEDVLQQNKELTKKKIQALGNRESNTGEKEKWFPGGCWNLGCNYSGPEEKPAWVWSRRIVPGGRLHRKRNAMARLLVCSPHWGELGNELLINAKKKPLWIKKDKAIINSRGEKIYMSRNVNAVHCRQYLHRQNNTNTDQGFYQKICCPVTCNILKCTYFSHFNILEIRTHFLVNVLRKCCIIVTLLALLFFCSAS